MEKVHRRPVWRIDRRKCMNIENMENITESNKEDIGPNITNSEFFKALSELKKVKRQE